jgi:plasmid stabilization system protein ParE
VRRVIWTAGARGDLAGIRAYIGQFNPTAAARFATRLVLAADSLAEMAERGRPIRGGRRELAASPPYLIRYRVAADVVFILRVRHGARRPD